MFRRIDPGEDHVAAAGAAEHPFLVVMNGGGAAAAAEPVAAIPDVQMPAGHNGKTDIFTGQLTEHTNRLIGKTGNFTGFSQPQVKVLLLQAENKLELSPMMPIAAAGLHLFPAGEGEGIVSAAADENFCAAHT